MAKVKVVLNRSGVRALLKSEEMKTACAEKAQAIRAFLGEMDDGQRVAFVDALFEVLGATNARTLSELDADWVKSISAMVRSYKTLSREARQMLSQALKVLLWAGTENLVGELETRGQELRRLLNRLPEGE